MSRRPKPTKDFSGRPQGVTQFRERREKADAERRRMLERYKEHHLAAEYERQARAAQEGLK